MDGGINFSETVLNLVYSGSGPVLKVLYLFIIQTNKCKTYLLIIFYIP